VSALRPFLIALQFLTRLPVRLSAAPEPEDSGRSILYYPLVGAILGVTIATLNWLLGNASDSVRAAVVLTAWVLITGALHLDGLADSMDAWVGGQGDRDKTLAIMKDPNCGPMGVVALILTLLLKFTALRSLAPDAWLILILIPAMGRGAALALFLTTPYVRPGGLGAAIASHLPRRRITAMLIASAPFLVCALTPRLWIPAAAAITVSLFVRHALMSRLGGTTGDTTGALIELTETVALIAATLFAR